MMCGLKLDVGGIKIKLQINDYKPTSKKKSANRFKAGEDDGKELSEMTLEELWQLFPICLTEHQSCWQEWYSEEEKLLKRTLSSNERISHIGSTATPSIWAKPIVDILVEIPKEICLNIRFR